MKIFKSILLLIIFAVITLIAEKFNKQLVEESIEQPIGSVDTLISNSRTNYKLDVEYLVDENLFLVEEIIAWKNTESFSVDTLFLNLPKSNIEANDNSSKFKYIIDSFNVNGKEVGLEYLELVEKNFIDSTLVKVHIPNGISENEIAHILIKYKIKLPKDKIFTDAHFYNFENWYITVSPYIKGESLAYPLHKFIEPFLEFANYEVKIVLPNNFDIAISGKLNVDNANDSKVFRCNVKNITRFNWFTFDELSVFEREISTQNKTIVTTLIIDESKDGYVERYFDMAEKYLKSLSKFSVYPFDNLTIVDLPNMSKVKSKSYPNLIALNSDLISPVKTQKLEYKMAYLISELYFGNLVTVNYMEESWLAKGISSYIAEKIVREHYGDLYSFFTIADYYPIYGLHFMTYAGIPIIYTVSNQVVPEGARFISEYYKNLTYTNLLTSTYLQPSYKAYKISSIIKPQIALLTLENMIGEKSFHERLKKYFVGNVFKYSTSNNFISVMTDQCSKENSNFYKTLFKSDNTFDYAIKYIKKRDDNIYDIMVERIEDGVMPIELVVNFESDTLRYTWDGKEKFKVFTIHCNNEILSAEIDSKNKNLLDLNFANNSYIVEEQYWGSVSYATRVFFWFQNALMLIGGKG